MPTQAKIDKVAELKHRFEEASNIFITDYAGLNVEQMTKLRKEMRDSGIRYMIAKNTLMRIAAQEAGYEQLTEDLSGPVAIAFSGVEPNIPARILYEAGKEFKEIGKPSVKSFYIGKQAFNLADMERLAKLPSREQLLSHLVTTIEGPIAELVGTLEGIMRELIGTVEAMARQERGS